MSEMISEMAGNFINLADTMEERQSRLNAASSAWNMACAPPEARQEQLDQYIRGYQQFNPAASEVDLKNIRLDMEALIQQKLDRFPGDQRQIVDATVVPLGKNYRIEVASATLD